MKIKRWCLKTVDSLVLPKKDMVHHLNIELACNHCNCNDICKNGKRSNGTQRWRCNKCRRSFQLNYSYEANKPGIKNKILEQTLNSSGVRDISRNLGVDKNTVVSTLRKKKVLT